MTPADLEFHQFLPSSTPGELLMPVTDRLCTPFGFLYGGTGISASTALAERLTERPLVWITTQYVANAYPGEVLRLRGTVVAEGRSTSQVQVVGTVDDRLVLTALAAHSNRPDIGEQHRGEPPTMPPPDECSPFVEPIPLGDKPSFLDAMERRVDTATAPDLVHTGHVGMWVRVPSWPGPSAAVLGFAADIVPVAVFSSFGMNPGATSLDNTLRVLDPNTTEWTLMDVEAQGINRAIGHGQVRMWSEDGRLLAVGSQSAIMRNGLPTAR